MLITFDFEKYSPPVDDAFFRILVARLSHELHDEISSAVHHARESHEYGDAGWDVMLADGIKSETFIAIYLLMGWKQISWNIETLRELTDSSGKALWNDYDGQDASVVFVDFLPSANWAHPSMAMLWDMEEESIHNRIRLRYPIEPPLSRRHPSDVVKICDLPKAELGR